MIAVEHARVEGRHLASIERYRAAVVDEITRLTAKLVREHGPGSVTVTETQDFTGGGVIVRAEWRKQDL